MSRLLAWCMCNGTIDKGYAVKLMMGHALDVDAVIRDVRKLGLDQELEIDVQPQEGMPAYVPVLDLVAQSNDEPKSASTQFSTATTMQSSPNSSSTSSSKATSRSSSAATTPRCIQPMSLVDAGTPPSHNNATNQVGDVFYNIGSSMRVRVSQPRARDYRASDQSAGQLELDASLGNYQVFLPVKFGRSLVELGIQLGKKINQTIPPSMLQADTPKSVVIEFMAAALGADGVAAAVRTKQPCGRKMSEAFIDTVRFCQSVPHELVKVAAKRIKTELGTLCERVGIDKGTVHIQKPNAGSETTPIHYHFSEEGTYQLHQLVGVRYNVAKHVTFGLAGQYMEGTKLRQEQWNRLWDRIKVSHIDGTSWDSDWKAALAEEIKTHNVFPNLHPSSGKDSYEQYMKHENKSQNRNGLFHSNCMNYAKQLGAELLLATEEHHMNKVKSYAVSRDSECESTWQLTVVDRRDIGVQKVFDLTVEHSSHLFLANGIAIHNCHKHRVLHRDLKPQVSSCGQIMSNGPHSTTDKTHFDTDAFTHTISLFCSLSESTHQHGRRAQTSRLRSGSRLRYTRQETHSRSCHTLVQSQSHSGSDCVTC